MISTSHQYKINSLVIMECYLNILEVPQKQEETFDEEKVKFIESKNFYLGLFWCLSSNLFELYERGKIQNIQRILY